MKDLAAAAAFLKEFTGIEINFLDWIKFAMPLAVVTVPAAVFLVYLVFRPDKDLGPVTFGQGRPLGTDCQAGIGAQLQRPALGPFDAAVPMAGIYDFADAYETADRVGRIFIKTGHSGSPDEQPDIYFEAGDHEQLVHVSAETFEALLGATTRHGSFSH